MSAFLLFLSLTITPPSTVAMGPSIDPFWVIGSDSPRGGEITDAWLVLPAALGSPTGSAHVEILAPVGLKAWVRREQETCEAARDRYRTAAARSANHTLAAWDGKEATWNGPIQSDEMVPICLLATRPQKMRLVARVRLPAGAPAPTVRVVATNAIEVQHRFDSAWLVAVFSLVSGFLAATITRLIEQRGEAKADLRKATLEIEKILARDLSAEILRNRFKLQDLLDNPQTEPDNVITTGGALLHESTGTFAYLSDRTRRAFLDKFLAVYDCFDKYNDAIFAKQNGRARDIAQRALELVDSSVVPNLVRNQG